MCLNAGSQILKICRSQIYEKLRSQIFKLKFETGSHFCVSEHWEPDFKFSNEPSNRKSRSQKFQWSKIYEKSRSQILGSSFLLTK